MKVGTLALDLFIILGLTAWGTLLLRIPRLRLHRAVATAIGFGLGSGLFSFSVFLMSWLGIPLTATTIVGLFVVLLLSTVVILRLIPDRETRPLETTAEPRSRLGDITAAAGWTAVGFLSILAAVLSVGLAYHSWDGISLWGVKGYGIALEGSVTGAANWGNSGISFPLNLPIQIAVFRILSGDLLPGSKLLSPGYYLALLVALGMLMKGLRVRRLVASSVIVLIASTPIIFQHARFAQTNLPFTFYLVIGFLVGLQSLERTGRGPAALSGVLLALAVWTRAEGVAFAVGLAAVLATSVWFKRGDLTSIGLIALPSLITAIVWAVFLRGHYTGAEEFGNAQAAIAGILTGEFYPRAVVPIVRFLGGQILLFRQYGLLLGSSLLIGTLGLLVRSARSNRYYYPVLAGVLVTGFIACAMYYVFAYSPRGQDFVEVMVYRAFDRTLMPTAVLASTLAALSISGLFGDKDRYLENDMPRSVRPRV